MRDPSESVVHSFQLFSKEYSKLYLFIPMLMDILGCFLYFSIKNHFSEHPSLCTLYKCLALRFVGI